MMFAYWKSMLVYMPLEPGALRWRGIAVDNPRELGLSQLLERTDFDSSADVPPMWVDWLTAKPRFGQGRELVTEVLPANLMLPKTSAKVALSCARVFMWYL